MDNNTQPENTILLDEKEPHLSLGSCQRQLLRSALRTVLNARNVRTGMILVSFSEELYFVERTLIELGILKGDKNLRAHREFFGLLKLLELELPERFNTHPSHMAEGAQLITKDFYPWVMSSEAAEERTRGGQTMGEADLLRWHAIYQLLRAKLKR